MGPVTELFWEKVFEKFYDRCETLFIDKILNKRKLDKLADELSQYHIKFCEEHNFAQTSKFQQFVENNLKIYEQYNAICKINYPYRTIDEIQQEIISLCIREFPSPGLKGDIESYYRITFLLIKITLYEIAQKTDTGRNAIMLDTLVTYIEEAKKELFTAINQILPPSFTFYNSIDVHNISLETAEPFAEEFYKELFLEKYRTDGEELKLSNLYVEPSYSFRSYMTEKMRNDMEILDLDIDNLLTNPANQKPNHIEIFDSDIEALLIDFTNGNLHEFLKKKNKASNKILAEGLFIIGQPGIGKTSLIIKIADDYIRGKIFVNRNVFFIKFKELNGSMELFESVCEYFNRTENINLTKNDFTNSILILDGFDELQLTNSIDIETYFNDFANIIKNISNCHFIVTSRTNYIPDDIIYSVYIELQIYDMKKTEIFIKNYSFMHRKINQNTIDSIIKNESDLFRIPLILYLVLSWNVNISNTKNKGNLYDLIFGNHKKYYGFLNARGEDIKDVNIKYAKKLSEIPPMIAYEMFKSNSLLISENIVKDYINNNEEYEAKVKKELQSRYGVANFYKMNRGYVEFIHTSLYDYFAAKKILNDIKDFLFKLSSYDKPVTEFIGTLENIFVNNKCKREILDFILNFCENDDNDFATLLVGNDEYYNFQNFVEKLISYGMCKQEEQGKEMFFEKAHRMFSLVYKIFYTLLVKYRPNETLLIKFKENTIKYIFFLNMDKPNLSLKYIFLAGADLHKISLNRADLKEAKLMESDLSKADLNEADLTKANLRLADISKANLNRAKLIETDLSEADLSKANLNKTDLNGAVLIDTDLNRASLIEASLIKADLTRADLRGANLTKTYLSEAWLNEAKLSEAILIDADLSGTKLSKANLNSANLSGTNLSNADLGGADLSGADLNTANLNGTNLRRASLRMANLSGIDFRKVNLRETDLREAILMGTDEDMRFPVSISLNHIKIFLNNKFSINKIKNCSKIYNDDGLSLASEEEINYEYKEWQKKIKQQKQ